MILDLIKNTRGLELSGLMGFASDGASVMVGEENGVAARLKRLVPELYSAHCIAHREALAAALAVRMVELAVKVDRLLTQVTTSQFVCRTFYHRAHVEVVPPLPSRWPGVSESYPLYFEVESCMRPYVTCR